MDKEREQWLKNLKPGDEVARFMSGGFNYGRIHCDFLTVERITTTLIIVKGGQRFRLSDGREPGSYRSYYIQPPTDELKAQLAEQARKDALLSIIDKVKWRDVPITTLETVCAALNLAEGNQ